LGDLYWFCWLSVSWDRWKVLDVVDYIYLGLVLKVLPNLRVLVGGLLSLVDIKLLTLILAAKIDVVGLDCRDS
jgi:hypothetical protein